MTKRPYDPKLRAEIEATLKAAEPFAEAEYERRTAIEKARRDLAAIMESNHALGRSILTINI